MSTIAEATVRAIFANPTLSNKQVSALVFKSHGGSTDKTVAWYRAHMKKGDLGKGLMALVSELGGSSKVPSALGTGLVRREPTGREAIEAELSEY